jgi:choline dehydrogenase
LEIRCGVMATRLLFEGKRAVGVEYLRGKKTEQVQGHEIILCGGAINSPQLLQLSGIGRAEDLREVGVDVLHDLPGVGYNLQDHLEVYVQYACKQPVSLYPDLNPLRQLWIGAQWLFGRTGHGATNHFEGGGFIRSNDTVRYPNLQYHFLPIAIRYDGTAPSGGHGYQVHVGPMNTDVRGRVKLRSTDPHEHPSLLFNYLSTEQECREWVEAIQCTRNIMTQPAFDPYRGAELAPGADAQTDDEVLDFIREEGESAYHLCSTCRMGTDADAVVDPAFRVHGIAGLRVVDASVFPALTNGNIYAPILMVAEKAADVILGKDPLPAEHLDFYVAGSG